MWPFNTGDCLKEVTALEGLTAYVKLFVGKKNFEWTRQHVSVLPKQLLRIFHKWNNVQIALHVLKPVTVTQGGKVWT